MTTPKASFRTIHSSVFFLILFCCFFVFSSALKAQQCEIIPQTITDLRDPTFAAPSLWSSAYGDKNLTDRFVGAAVYEDTGDLLLAGERFWKDGQDVSLTLVKMSRNGRLLWDKIYSGFGFKDVVKVIRAGDAFIVLAVQAAPKTGRDSLWLGVFDESGSLTKQKMITDPKLTLAARDIVYLPDLKEMMVVANTVPAKEGDAFFSVFYRFDLDLKQKDKKALNIGLNNAIGALDVSEDGDVIAGGILVNREGRRAGWILSLNPRVIINWERQYTRGASAQFDAVRSYKDEYIVLSGHSVPYFIPNEEVEPDNVGAWVMAVDRTNGERIWERFYTEEDFNLVGRDLHIFEDGRISVVMNAKRLKAMQESQASTDIESAKGFVRIVSFNRRGVVIESNGYFGAEDVRADGLLVGKAGERILYGSSLVPYNLPSRPLIAAQAWVNVADSIAPYRDPCVRQ